MQIIMVNPWYDLRGYYRTGFDAHVLAWRYQQTLKFEQHREAFAILAKRA